MLGASLMLLHEANYSVYIQSTESSQKYNINTTTSIVQIYSVSVNLKDVKEQQTEAERHSDLN